MSNSRGRVIGYWVATAALLLPMGAGGVADIMMFDDVAKTFAHLGYPRYFGIMLGVAKLLGLAVLLAPGLRRAKEWAYAGIAIDLSAAAISHVAVDGLTKDVVPPVVFLAVVVTSWFLRPENRRLEGPLL